MAKSDLFYWVTSLSNFYYIHGHNGSPVTGTINDHFGYSSNNPVGSRRFAKPLPHPNDEEGAFYDSHGELISINGGQSATICAKIVNTLPDKFIETLLGNDQEDAIAQIPLLEQKTKTEERLS